MFICLQQAGTLRANLLQPLNKNQTKGKAKVVTAAAVWGGSSMLHQPFSSKDDLKTKF